MIVCWSVKGGSGTTVVASTLALVHAAQSSRGALIVDLAGDVPAVLGLAEPTGIGASEWLAQPEKSARMSLQSIAIQATANLQMISRGAVAVPIIGRLFKRVELRASAVMPRQLATN